MNRIYQGRVSAVERLKPGTKNDWEPLRNWEDVLWNHHELFQDAVNYYILALASLGTSPQSKLTQLRSLLEAVWTVTEKKGQRRQGMRDSLQRAWQLPEPPTLAEAAKRFTAPLIEDNVALTTAEKAAEYLLFKLGGDASIQQGAPVFFPMFCAVDCDATFRLSAASRGRAQDERRLQRELHRDLTQAEIEALARSITLGSVVFLQPNSEPDRGAAVIERLRTAARTFNDEISQELLEKWLATLDPAFALPKRRGGNINVRRVDACTLFLAFPNQVTKTLFQSTFSPPRSVQPQEPTTIGHDESRFVVNGDDPIKLARGTRGFVFPGFTALPLWDSDGRTLAWKEFDIAAFEEALKVYNQFQQNLERREEKLTGLAAKLLIMDGEQALRAYGEPSDARFRNRLEKLWHETDGKPKPPKNEAGEEPSLPRFSGDPRIDRLRAIVNDDLADEYRLTDGRRTPYGLRRRTMKGWGEIKRRWQKIVGVGEEFSEAKRKDLQAVLDELRGGEKREQIGSHLLFEALLKDEAAWSIWREPDNQLQEKINSGWAADPLEAFRDYCETREAFEEISLRPLNFTPADPRYSRRLFMFTDVCSFGNPRGIFKHDSAALAVTVPVALPKDDGRLSAQPCRITYSAPRLLRDRIRDQSGSYAQDWVQPMVRALFGETEHAANPQDLKDAAVQLMPDYDSKGHRRILLNFPLDLDEAPIKARIGKAALWERQFVSWKKGAQLPFLRWDAEFDGKEPHRWWEKVQSFRVLAADLGTRNAASVAVIECSKTRANTSRFIGRAGQHDWFARYRGGSILRLPGEDAYVLRPKTRLDCDELGKAFREEIHGQRGRLATDAECAETIAILTLLRQTNLLDEGITASELQKRFSFPEQNDKLLVAIRRAQNWVATCISWHWKITQPEDPKQRQIALEQLAEQKRVPAWQDPARRADTVALANALHEHIVSLREQVQRSLLQLTNRVLPLRGRSWEWVPHPDKPDCHLLRQTMHGTGPNQTKLRGQRGLSLPRIEQISELRRRWQSLNQSLRRQIGERPPTASEMRSDPIPDPCPDILTKLENIREQRVNQTAHLILAKALGLNLREPRTSPELRRATDMHGEYEVAHPPVDFIVLEDLSRYLSDQGRAKSENTRLMKWCHRAITQKVKMLAEPFGIPVLETPAAYSSRFCALTGMAGFRAAEVSWDDRHKFRWRVLLDEADKVKTEGRTASLNAERAAALFETLKAISQSDRPHRSLVAPQPGGPLFVTAKAIPHPAPNLKRVQGHDGSVLPIHADLNAAINLALRAVAHPACAHIHHRLRTERKKGTKAQPDSFLAREPRRFGKAKIAIIGRDTDSLPRERNTNFFFDEHGVVDFGRARLSSDDSTVFPYASGPALWKKVNDRAVQWDRCDQINRARLAAWKREEDDIPM